MRTFKLHAEFARKVREKMENNITVTYAAVQVVQRSEDGTLTQWYDQGMRGTLKEAREDAVRLHKEFPGCEYTVIERTIKEVRQVFTTGG